MSIWQGKNLVLAAAIILIAAAIVFLEGTKNQTVDDSTVMQEGLENNPAAALDETVIPALSDAEMKARAETIKIKEERYERAKELVRPFGYINTNSSVIKLSDYLGKKVILIDFWTYSCVNCQRTFPYLNAWHEKYTDDGLLIIGVHRPEFEFEKDYDNVKAAVEKYGIKFPVVLDNAARTWNAYGNQYWPREYLIDIDGFIVYNHIGEGGYERTEEMIRNALEERRKVLKITENIDSDTTAPNATSVDFGKIKTPEIYLGYSFSRGQLGNSEGYQPGKAVKYSSGLVKNNLFYLDGTWLNNEDNMQSVENSHLTLKYTAKSVNIVAGSDTPADVQVKLDGKEYKTITVDGHDLYNVATLDGYGEHTVEMIVAPGVKIYTFTFG